MTWLIITLIAVLGLSIWTSFMDVKLLRMARSRFNIRTFRRFSDVFLYIVEGIFVLGSIAVFSFWGPIYGLAIGLGSLWTNYNSIQRNLISLEACYLKDGKDVTKTGLFLEVLGLVK